LQAGDVGVEAVRNARKRHIDNADIELNEREAEAAAVTVAQTCRRSEFIGSDPEGFGKRLATTGGDAKYAGLGSPFDPAKLQNASRAVPRRAGRRHAVAARSSRGTDGTRLVVLIRPTPGRCRQLAETRGLHP
jgi:hypothetical protein